MCSSELNHHDPALLHRYLVDSILLVHGVQTMLRSERRYKHFNLFDHLLRKAFGPLVPHALPAKRAFGNLQPSFVEERRVALEKCAPCTRSHTPCE